MNACAAGSDLVSDWQRAPPVARCNVTGDCREQRPGVGVPDGKYGDFGEYLHILERQTLCILGRPDSRRQRISLVESHLHHAAALHTVRRTSRSDGEGVVLSVSIVRRIRIDDAANGAMLTGDLRLDSAP